MINCTSSYCAANVPVSDESKSAKKKEGKINFRHSKGKENDPNYDLIKQRLFEEYRIDAQKIQDRYPEGLKDKEIIDLSCLELKHLPPEILLECSNAKTLNLSKNNIHWLPKKLEKIDLEKLDISENKRLQPNFSQFTWLLEMPRLRVVANDMGFNFTPRGWEGRFESNEIPTDNYWMSCQTQDD